jgi:hypothetical protein
LWQKGACRFGAVLLAAIVLLGLLATRDRARVEKLEQFEEVSAVGDTAYFRRPAGRQEPALAVATLRGQPLYLLTEDKRELKDTNMLRVARDDASGLAIYTPRKPLPREPGEKTETQYFLKLGRNDYINVGPAPPAE